MAATKRAAAVAVSKVASAAADEVRVWGRMRQTGVSLKDMMEFGARGPTEENLVHSARFLHRELPIRIARRVVELDDLPFRLSSKPPVLKVRDWYLDSFRDLRGFRAINSSSDEAAFTRMIKNIKVRHNNVVPAMAMGINQLKKELGPRVSDDDLDEIQGFLDRFYLSRIGIRMLIGQHVALHEDGQKDAGGGGRVVGQIDPELSPVLVARNAAEDARAVCLREYGAAPDINIYGDPGFTFPYVPCHLHLMMFELVKNSLRAVQERYMDSDHDPPPVRIVVADGVEDVTLKISDEGGGIRRSGLPKIFTYLYSTAKINPLEEYNHHGAVDGGCTMAGYGYGLPISRLYARYFGGDLQVISMEGYGTDAYLHLCRLGNSREPLP